MSSVNGASATRGRQTLGDNLKFGLKCGASALALSLVFGASALAQTAGGKTTEDTVDEVVVTSIRQSLKSSQQLKQSSEITTCTESAGRPEVTVQTCRSWMSTT